MSDQSIVEVTQADRDAAADYMAEVSAASISAVDIAAAIRARSDRADDISYAGAGT